MFQIVRRCLPDPDRTRVSIVFESPSADAARLELYRLSGEWYAQHRGRSPEPQVTAGGYGAADTYTIYWLRGEPIAVLNVEEVERC